MTLTKTPCTVTMDTCLFIRALQEDSATKIGTDRGPSRRWEPSEMRANLANYLEGFDPQWALHAEQLNEITAVVGAIVYSGKMRYREGGLFKERLLLPEEQRNAHEFLNFLKALRNSLQSDHPVPKVAYTRLDGKGLGVYMIASQIAERTGDFIRAARGRTTNPTTETTICLNAYYQARQSRHTVHEIFTMDGDLDLIQAYIRDTVYGSIPQEALNAQLPEPLVSFRNLICYEDPDGRKAHAILPKVNEVVSILGPALPDSAT